MKQPLRQLLASDNASGVHPEVLARLAAVNAGHVLGYGQDDITRQALERFREHFGEQAQTFLMFNGTATNVLALKGMLQSHETVYCSAEAHLLVDECGAPEHYVGCKLVPVAGRNGKLALSEIRRRIGQDRGVVHRSQPRVVSLAQATERGTVYRLEELREIVAFAREHDLLVHMDGARIANAAAALGSGFVELTTQLGVDVLSFGGTKNGLMMAEALVVLNPALHDAYPYIRKQGMQLAAKQRFLAAQFLAYFDGELWRRNALHANAMAALLAQRLAAFDAVMLTAPVEVNMVFARLPNAWIGPLQRLTPFLVWPGETHSEVRLVTSFDTSPEAIDHFIDEIRRLVEPRPDAGKAAR